jgi:hypothetical protein
MAVSTHRIVAIILVLAAAIVPSIAHAQDEKNTAVRVTVPDSLRLAGFEILSLTVHGGASATRIEIVATRELPADKRMKIRDAAGKVLAVIRHPPANPSVDRRFGDAVGYSLNILDVPVASVREILIE